VGRLTKKFKKHQLTMQKKEEDINLKAQHAKWDQTCQQGAEPKTRNS
jgi:hypothetical protein